MIVINHVLGSTVINNFVLAKNRTTENCRYMKQLNVSMHLNRAFIQKCFRKCDVR